MANFRSLLLTFWYILAPLSNREEDPCETLSFSW
jgi:hypothetical protein